MTADFRAIHHREIEMLPDPEEWIEAHISVAEKWDGRMPRDRHRAGQLARARAARRGRARRRARAMAHTKVARARGARPRAASAASPRRAASLSWRLDRPAAPASRAADDRLRLRDRRRRRPTGASPSRASGAPPSPTPTVLAFAAVGLDLPRLQPAARRRRRARRPRGARARRPARRDRRPGVLRQGRARRSRDPGGRASPGRVGARDVRTIAWWEGEVSGAPRRPPLLRARRRRAGRLRLGAARRAARRGRRASTASCSCSRRGRCATLRFDESLRARPRLRRRLLPAGPRGRAARSSPPTSARSTTARSSWCRDLEVWVEGHIRSPRSGTAAGRAARRGERLEAPRAPRRGRARGRAHARLLERARGSTPRSLALERELDGDDGQPVVAAHRAAARGSTAAPRRAASRRRARGGSRPWRPRTCSVATPARTRSRDSRSATRERARLQQPPQHRLLARAPLALRPQLAERAWRLREVVDAVGLQPLEHRVAVPRVEDRAPARRRTARPACQTTPKPKNTGTTASRSRSRPPTKSSTAVSTPLRGPPSRAAERG